MEVTLSEDQLANRVLWVRDLLSGNYQQGNGTLKRKLGDGHFEYCCLGVACERVLPNVDELRLRDNGAASWFMRHEDAEVHFGLGSNDQHIAGKWNDVKRYTFKRIADLVAYATEHRFAFADVYVDNVPEDYAVGWLNNDESNNDESNSNG